MPRKFIPMVGVLLVVCASSATAQKKLEVGHCVADLKRLCAGIEPGNDRLQACMEEHLHDVSTPCLVTLSKLDEVREFDKECSEHLKQQCGTVESGQVGACLKSAVASLSHTCKDELARAVHGAR